MIKVIVVNGMMVALSCHYNPPPLLERTLRYACTLWLQPFTSITGPITHT